MNTTDLISQYYAQRRNFDNIVLQNETLHGLEFEGCSFRHANFCNVEFRNVRFERCDLTGADLRRCSMPSLTVFDDSHLDSVDLRNAVLVATQFTGSTFLRADLSRARVIGVWFIGCELSEAWLAETHFESVTLRDCNVDDAFVGGAVFVDSDLANLVDAPKLRFADSPVIVDWRSICRSLRAVRLPQFLRATGLPDIVVTYLMSCARSEDPNFLINMLQSTFISYGAPDESFARRLRDELHRNGVRTFFFPTDAVPGRKLHEVMREGVNKFDRVILICSKASLSRPAVLNEIQEALAREARDGGRSYLIPIALDGYLFEWEHPLAQPLRDRVVADFRVVDDLAPNSPREAYSASSPYRSGPQELFDVASSPSQGFNAAVRSLLLALRPEDPGA